MSSQWPTTNSRKRPRRNRGSRRRPPQSSETCVDSFDLNIPLPFLKSKSASRKKNAGSRNYSSVDSDATANLVSRSLRPFGEESSSKTAGLRSVALSRTINGRLDEERGQEDHDAEWETLLRTLPPEDAKAVLRRLTASVHDASTAGYYASPRRVEDDDGGDDLRNRYDVVAVRPTSDGAFQALCAGLATVPAGELPPLDMVSIETNERKSSVMRIDRSSLISLSRCGVALELNYATAVSDPSGKVRLNFLKMANRIMETRIGIRPEVRVVLSSGIRPEYGGSDLGVLALRTWRDIANVVTCLVPGVSAKIARNMMGLYAEIIVRRAAFRKAGGRVAGVMGTKDEVMVVRAVVEEDESIDENVDSEKDAGEHNLLPEAKAVLPPTGDGEDDGFIAF